MTIEDNGKQIKYNKDNITKLWDDVSKIKKKLEEALIRLRY